MPKAYDVKHNYYADLDLPTTASVDDVKKQYRKLALQYHPDRNAGKEDEYIPKFQAIQAAHEILGEPAEKSRYDADRRKAGLYPTSGGASAAGARGNPYTATSAYPPPPRRTQPGTYQRPQPSGADRFSNFPRGAAPTAKRADPAAERQNAFKAWQNMNNAQDRQQQQARYAQASAQAQAKTASPRRPGPPPPPRNDPKFPTDEKIRAGFNYREPPQASPADNAEDRQSAWAAFQKSHATSPGVRRSNTNKTPKKAGFDPNMPGSDEGMAPDSQYAHRHKSADFGRPSAAPPPPPRPSHPDSPKVTSQRPHADPLRPFKSRTGTAEDDAPYSEGNRVRTPYTSFSGERTDFGSDIRRSNSSRDTTKLNPGSNTSRARSTSPLRRTSSGRSPESQHHAQPNHNKPSFSVGGSSSTSSESSEAENVDTSGKTAVPPQNRPKIVPSPPSRRYNGSANPTSPPDANGLNYGQKSNSNIFSFPTSPGMFSPTARDSKSRSEESINTKFSADGWSGTFSGSADYFAPPQASSRRGSPSLRGGQRPSMRTTNSSYGQPASEVQSPTSTTNMPPPPRPYAASSQDGAFSDLPSAGSDTKFSKDQWEQTFKDGSWTWPPPPPMSPSKGGSKKQPSRKNSRAHSKPTSSSGASTGTANNPHVVDEEDDQTVDPRSTNNYATAPNPTVNEPDAMDIDNSPPATEQSSQQVPHAEPVKSPRLVSVPPSAWRQSQQPHKSSSHHRTTSAGSNHAPLKANLNDLANVAPFNQASDGTGLQDFKSMSSTLPFPSQAANTLPTNPLKPQTLSTPVVPIPPKAPTRLSKQSWHQYAQNFGVYLLAFNSFNSAMLQHFQARNQEAAVRMQKGLAWLEATGDPVAGGGFGTYAREVKEDERVRETWNMGCERQADAVKEFDDVRERVRRLAVAGTIADQ